MLGVLGRGQVRTQPWRVATRTASPPPSLLLLYSQRWIRTEAQSRKRRTRAVQPPSAAAATATSSNTTATTTAIRSALRGAQATAVDMAAVAAPELPPEIEALLQAPRVIPGLTVIVADSASNAFEMARVLHVKNRGTFHQGWVGDLIAAAEAPPAAGHGRVKRVIITWTLGQMFSLVGEDLKPRRWAARGVVPAGLEELPWLPSRLRVAARPGPSNARQIKILQALLSSAAEIVSAVEPDAEGEVLFRDLLTYVGLTSRPFKRAWLRSRTDSDVIEAFSNLIDGRALEPLALLALYSRITDHLTGVNWSSLVSVCASPRPEIFVESDGTATVIGLGRAHLGQSQPSSVPEIDLQSNSSEDQLPAPEDVVHDASASAPLDLVAEDDSSSFLSRPTVKKASPIAYQESVYNVGRIQTPMLRLIVERYITHYRLLLSQQHASHGVVVKSYLKDRSDNTQLIPWIWCGRESDIGRSTPSSSFSAILKGHHLACKSLDEAVDIAASLDDKLRIVHLSQRNRTEPPPRLYNLTALQADASKVLGLSPHATLVIAMQLFEARVISYPKTSCDHLPSQLSSEFLNTVLVWSKASRFRVFSETVSPRARLTSSRRDSRIFRDFNPIAQHHAIIPVLPSQKADAKVIDAYLAKLNDAQKRLLDLIVARLFESCLPEAETQEVDLIATSSNVNYFSSKLAFTVNLGWKKVATLAQDSLMSAFHPSGPIKRFKLSTPDSDATADGGTGGDVHPLQRHPVSLPVDVHLGDTVALEQPKSMLNRVVDFAKIAGVPMQGGLVTDADLVHLMAEPSDDHRGAAIADVSTRSAALQQLIHWKYVVYKNGTYTPTRRGIRLIKLLSDEPVSQLDNLVNQEIQLRRVASGACSPETYLSSLKESLNDSIASLAARRHLFLPYDVDSFHANQGRTTYELKNFRSECCPKCRTSGSLIMGITAVFCNQSACNFSLSTTIVVKAAAGGFESKLDLLLELSILEKVRLLRGERVQVNLKTYQQVSEINVEVLPPRILQSSAAKGSPLGSFAPSPKSPDAVVRTVEVFLDPQSRFEMIIMNVTNPEQPKRIFPAPRVPSLPAPRIAQELPLVEADAATSDMLVAIRSKATPCSSLWDEWVGDADYRIPSLIPHNPTKKERVRKDAKDKRPMGDLVRDDVTRMRLQLESLKLKRRLAAMSQPSTDPKM